MARYAESLPFLSRHAERRGQMAELRNRLEAALADRYTIGQEIGRGGMAIVYLAHDLRHDRDVALKVLRPELAATLGPDRFLQEIRLAAGLSHPHILPLHDSGDADGCLFYVMPYVPGESLRDRLEAQGQLPLVEALEIAGEIADALDYAHRAGVVHRDIKPENILLQSGHAAVSDFGIARAISAAGERRWTAAGLAVGTPDYMSPEQAAGAGQIDGRSDLYSLGCVLFEMLAGRPPLALTPPEGPQAGPVLARDRLAELAVLRPSVPREVASVVARLLAVAPSDRFDTAAEAVDALRVPGEVWTPRSVAARRRKRAVGMGLAATVVIGGLALLVAPRVLNANLDRSLYVVVPFGHRAGAGSALLDGGQCELLMSEAFGHWIDLHLMDRLQVSDALARQRDTVMTLASAKRVAREVGAGRLVWGQVSEAGDSIVVTATLYDLTGLGRTLRTYSVRIDRRRTLLAVRFRDLADSLLLGAGKAREALEGSIGTTVLNAFYAYSSGQDALGRWDLDSAERAFRGALALDPAYPQAHLWLAQTLAWLGQPTEAWQYHAQAATHASQNLGFRDRPLAEALVRLGAGDYQAACGDYRRIAARDSLQFAAWFGLGECLRQDHAVVRDPGSPTGWTWRSSMHAAEAAYERALLVATSAAFRFPPFRSLAAVLSVDQPFSARWGKALAPDTGFFLGYPMLSSDTLAFSAVRKADFASAPLPATTRQAVAASQARLLRLVREWVREFPDSSQPYQELSVGLEQLGALDSTAGGSVSALDAAQRAFDHARNTGDSIDGAVLRVRLLVKAGRFEEAQRFASDELRRWRDPEPLHAAEVATLAAVLGRGRLVARAERVRAQAIFAGPFSENVPLPVLATARALGGFAAVGEPRDSIALLAARLDTMVFVYGAPQQALHLRCDVTLLPMADAFPELGRVTDPQRCPSLVPMIAMQRALVRRDTAAMRSLFARANEFRAVYLPGELAIEHVFHETWLLLQVGDTATATQYADRHLSALPAMRSTVILDEPVQAAGLIRLMALRAELAARAGDRITARRWAEPVSILWRDADPELQPLVERMRSLMAARR